MTAPTQLGRQVGRQHLSLLVAVVVAGFLRPLELRLFLNLHARHGQHRVHTRYVGARHATYLFIILYVLAGQTDGCLCVALHANIVEHSVEVHRVQLHRHLDRRVLLEVHQRLLRLRVHDDAAAFYLLPFVDGYLLAVQYQQRQQTLDHNRSVVRFACDWVR